MPIENQLKNLFAQNNFYDNLQGRFKKHFDNSYEDITDGTLYRNLFNNNGPLSSPDNLSFVLNTDGAPVFRSSKVSIWPVFLVINELPFKIRMKKENMILAALWFGNEKLAMVTFLKPLQKSFVSLKNGIKCFSPERGEFQSKCFLLAATADLPAQSLLCNSVQFNGNLDAGNVHNLVKRHLLKKATLMCFLSKKKILLGPSGLQNLLNEIQSKL